MTNVLVLIICLFIHYAHSSSNFTVSQIGHFGFDGAVGVDKDSYGNLYISGAADQDVFGCDNAGNYDVYVSKYDEYGNLVQGFLYGSTDAEAAKGQALSLDEQTIFVVGLTRSSWFTPKQGYECGFLLSIQTQNLSAMNWGQQLCGTGGALAQTELLEVAVDPTNASIIYTIGFSEGSFAAYGETTHGFADGFVIQWNAITGNITWMKLVGGGGSDVLFDGVVDQHGNIWTTGWFVTSYYDCVLFKWAANGTNLLQKTYGTSGGDLCYSLAMDDKEGAFVSGATYGYLDYPWQISTATNYSVPFVMHVDAAGNVEWLTQLNSTGDVTLAKIRTDSDNVIYATGWADKADFDGNPSIGNLDVVYATFLPNGTKITSLMLGTNGSEQAFDIFVDSNNVYMVGLTDSSWTADVQAPQDTILITTASIDLPPSSSSKGKGRAGLIAGVVVGGSVFIFGTAAAVFFIMKRKRASSQHSNIEMSRSPNASSSSHIRDAWEIDYRKLERGRELGRGAFGVVYLAKWRNSSVAVKQLDTHSTNAQTTANFLKEAQNVRNLRPHPNICTILGVCTNPEYPICIVMEYIPFGSLNDMLVEKKILLDPFMVVQFATDVASGMGHLHAESIIHCDLACRNLLVSARGSEFQIKISDFGLSRMVEATEYVSTNHSFPVRWSAPETLRMGKLSRASDVWSFGITLWEMVEERLPYPGLSNAEVPAQIEKGYRLPKPTKQDLPESFYKLMLRCWEEIPSARPTFEEISKELASIEAEVPKVEEVYAEQFRRASKIVSSEENYNTMQFNRDSTYNNNNNNVNHNYSPEM